MKKTNSFELKSTCLPSGPSESEVRAYVYQQLSDVEPMLPQGSSLTVALQASKKGDRIRAIITAKTPHGSVRGVAWRSDPFEAINEAKEDFLNRLFLADELEDMDPRDIEIEILSQGTKLH